jgi:NTP pyrophosphatase (non-canonical NTP hydrolase)
MVKVAVLTEECGEVARAALDCDPDALREELVQVAAVAYAILEGIE